MKKLNIFILFILANLWITGNSYCQNKDTAKPAPDTVRIGAYFISIHDINFKDKEYTARFWMWMKYNNPEFDFINQLDIPNAKSMERPDMMVDTSSGITWVLVRMQCVMKQSWDIMDYPFDDQKLHLHVENSMFDSNSLVFIPDTAGSNYHPELIVDGWQIKDFKVYTENHPYQTAFGDPRAKKQYSEYASFNIDFQMERSAWGLFLKIFIGMYIAFLIAVVSFFIDPENVEPRFGLPVGGLFAAVGNKYIIDSILPENLSFTLVDTLHNLTFLFIFFTIATSAVTLIYLGKGKEEKAKKYNKRMTYIVIGAYAIINIALVGLAIIH